MIFNYDSFDLNHHENQMNQINHSSDLNHHKNQINQINHSSDLAN